eukprot:7539760-Pyramimonas_sp.AAC.1
MDLLLLSAGKMKEAGMTPASYLSSPTSPANANGASPSRAGNSRSHPSSGMKGETISPKPPKPGTPAPVPVPRDSPSGLP